MKIKGRYEAKIVIDLETQEFDNKYYEKAIKDYWMAINRIVTDKMPTHSFLKTEVTQQLFDIHEVKG